MENKDTTFKSNIETLFKGLDSFITTKTVVGEPMEVGENIILPLADVTFGVGAGAFSGDKANRAGGGMGGKIEPSAILVISKDSTRLVNIKKQDGVTKILDMVPDIVNKVSNMVSGNKEEEIDVDGLKFDGSKPDTSAKEGL